MLLVEVAILTNTHNVKVKCLPVWFCRGQLMTFAWFLHSKHETSK